jgi:potassium-transporting ATPase KdpC subunit
MRRQLLPALRMVLVLTVVLGLAYPLVVTLAAQGLFNGSANGSLVKVNGQVVGSKLLGQTFTGNQYFQGRPSGIPDNLTAIGALASNGQPGDPKDLSLSNSGGSNYGPNNSTFLNLVSQRVAAYRKLNGLSPSTKVPVDAVTSSASGVDPEISVANARLQVPRVARARRLSPATVDQLVDTHTDSRPAGVLGDPGVNVLELNLALDRATRS